jgi:hypothetical protein
MNWSGWLVLVPVIATVSTDPEVRRAKSFLESR